MHGENLKLNDLRIFGSSLNVTAVHRNNKTN